MRASTVLPLAVSLAVDAWMPERGGVSVNFAAERKAVFGIQY
jgi:hypothetical protein